jgi:hypothetical protein
MVEFADFNHGRMEILVTFVWLIALAGQLGTNPISAVMLIGPLIPGAECHGVTPTAIVVALAAGWAGPVRPSRRRPC